MNLTVQGLSLTAAQWGALLNKSSIRDEMRQRRRNLSAFDQANAAQQLANQFTSFPPLKDALNVAVYLANDGEIDPAPLANWLEKQGKTCFLPALHPKKSGHLLFAALNGPRVTNRFGIEEPDPARNTMLEAKEMDLVLLPLVAFDTQGARLGMGGGFYDRTFAFLSENAAEKTNQPILIGLAHQFQQLPQLPVESWDVPLAGIITDKSTILLSKSSG